MRTISKGQDLHRLGVLLTELIKLLFPHPTCSLSVLHPKVPQGGVPVVGRPRDRAGHVVQQTQRLGHLAGKVGMTVVLWTADVLPAQHGHQGTNLRKFATWLAITFNRERAKKIRPICTSRMISLQTYRRAPPLRSVDILLVTYLRVKSTALSSGGHLAKHL